MPVSAQNPVDNDQQPAVSNQGSESHKTCGGRSRFRINNPDLTIPCERVCIRGSKWQSAPSGNPSESVAAMRIAPGDDVDITVFGVPDLTQHLRVSNSGENFSSSGRKPTSCRVYRATRHKPLSRNVWPLEISVNDPQVSVYVKEYTTEGISLIGEVSKPGVYSALVGHRLQT